MVVPPLPRLLVLLLAVLPPLRRLPLLRRRRRVSQLRPARMRLQIITGVLTNFLSIAKEESDEDMGFGLFD